jgi:hypothetical protein
MRKIIGVGVALCLAAFASLAVSALAAPGAQTVDLDFHEAVTAEHPNDGAAGPVTAPEALTAGQQFLLVVRGTVSAYNVALWEQPTGWKLCGSPEPAPLFASPFVTNGKVGTDAEFNFGRPLQSNQSCAAFPRHQVLFEMDLGDGFQHYEPRGGTPSAPASDHQYTYQVTGRGQPISFREVDTNTNDNYGVYRITIMGADSCKNGGWQNFPGLTFRNQGECVSYFNHA